MLCSHGLQSSLSQFMNMFWPVCSLWLEVKPDPLQENIQQLCSRLELMDKLQYKILDETEPVPASMAIQPVCYQLEKEEEHFDQEPGHLKLFPGS
ncbi:hypothetical protein LDENG_00219100 [Lucifuga dentata]|nr:hypothetical protein LDENG_00219100 [Lucifuga dentata]